MIQLLTIEALKWMCCRPEIKASVNIGILTSKAYHVKCLNRQQFYNINT